MKSRPLATVRPRVPLPESTVPACGERSASLFKALRGATRVTMILKILRAFFPKPMTEDERRWATVLAVSCERVR